MSHDAETDRYFVAAAYGPTSDWWLNVVEQPDVSIDIDGRRVKALAVPASEEESVAIMSDFADERPRAFRYSCRRAGIDPAEPESARRLAAANPIMSFEVAGADA